MCFSSILKWFTSSVQVTFVVTVDNDTQLIILNFDEVVRNDRIHTWFIHSIVFVPAVISTMYECACGRYAEGNAKELTEREEMGRS